MKVSSKGGSSEHGHQKSNHRKTNEPPNNARGCVKTQIWSFWKTKKWFKLPSPKIKMRQNENVTSTFCHFVLAASFHTASRCTEPGMSVSISSVDSCGPGRRAFVVSCAVRAPVHKKIANKKLAIAGIASVVVIGFFLIVRSPEERGSRSTFIGFTNGTIGPHAMFLLQGPASWNLREVPYEKGGALETWIPPSRGGAEFGSVFRRTNQTERWWGPQPFEFTLGYLGSELLANVSIPDTNA